MPGYPACNIARRSRVLRDEHTGQIAGRAIRSGVVLVRPCVQSAASPIAVTSPDSHASDRIFMRATGVRTSHECAFAPRATSGSSAWLACSGAVLISAEVEPLTRRWRPGASRRPTPPTPSAAGRTRHLLPGGQHRPQRSNKHLPSASTDPACCRCNRSGRAPLGSNRFVDSRQRTEIQELKHALAQAAPPRRFCWAGNTVSRTCPDPLEGLLVRVQSGSHL
jgi:hypothetical protein